MNLSAPKIKLPVLNGHLICGLCGGYLIDATVLTECVHVFCRSCILKYLTEHKVCPLCQSLIQETRPGQALRPDIALQRVVYKLVPGLLRTEMQRLMDFYSSDLSENAQDDEGMYSLQSGTKEVVHSNLRLDLNTGGLFTAHRLFSRFFLLIILVIVRNPVSVDVDIGWLCQTHF